MSDKLRKDFSTKLDEKITPDSQKTAGQQLKENVTDQVDKLGSKAQPESEKSHIQKVADSFQQGVDDAKKQSTDGKPLTQTAGEYVESAKKYVNDAIENFTSGQQNVKDSSATTSTTGAGSTGTK